MSKETEESNTDEVIDRLLIEVRSLRLQLHNIQAEIYKSGPDFEKLSTTGAIKKIIQDRREAQREVSKLNREISRLIKTSK